MIKEFLHPVPSSYVAARLSVRSKVVNSVLYDRTDLFRAEKMRVGDKVHSVLWSLAKE